MHAMNRISRLMLALWGTVLLAACSDSIGPDPRAFEGRWFGASDGISVHLDVQYREVPSGFVRKTYEYTGTYVDAAAGIEADIGPSSIPFGGSFLLFYLYEDFQPHVQVYFAGEMTDRNTATGWVRKTTQSDAGTLQDSVRFVLRRE